MQPEPSQRHNMKVVWLATSFVMAWLGPARAANPDPLEALKRMSVEELLNVEVTSVSRREEGLRNAPAAVAVINREDMRRSGATSMPELLRMVPGLHVARQNSSAWAVSSRGFSAVTSEKLLVLTDTRSLYTPLLSGVAWDVQDYLIEDIERVEVIRGPGAALWGSNAVNGVINITTRSARDTHGDYVEAGVGGFEGFWLGARHGGETAGGKHFRVFGRYFDREGTRTAVTTSDDEWRMGHLGFRADWDAGDQDSWTVQGDAYSGKFGQIEPAVVVIGVPGPEGRLVSDVSGGNVLARWRRSNGDQSDLQVRAYYDYTRREDPSFTDTLHTLDVDLQQRLTPGERHELIWGVAARATSNDNERGPVWVMDPEKSDDQVLSGFVQDRMRVTETLEVTLGTKLEDNDFSGFEIQPSARLAWTPTDRQTYWAAVSRAVRVPTRFERDISINATDPAGNPVFRLLGNRDFDAERLVAYELGYRWLAGDNLAFDLALFYNDYDKLASVEIGTPFIDPDTGQTVIPVINQNLGAGHTLGGELLAEWQPTDYWRVSASYSGIDLDFESSGIDANRNTWLEGSTPRGQFSLRSLLTLQSFDIDAQFRHHTRIRRVPVIIDGSGFDAYSSLDLRLGWRVAPGWELSLVGQNLLEDEHVEFGGVTTRGALERTAYLKAEWRH